MESISNRNEDNSNRNEDNPKSKVITNKIKKVASKILGPLMVIFWILMVSGAIIHIILLIWYSIPFTINNLDYCEYNYGEGWWRWSISSENICLFEQENGIHKVEHITIEQIKSRYCERKFYSPLYCGEN